MAAVTLMQNESVPSAYPAAPDGLSTAAAALDADMVWYRIERYVAHRWTERAVEWTVEGCGEWHPPLTPATVSTVEIWRNDAWETVTLSPSPYGGYLLPGGTYRFTATVGGGSPAPEVPATVSEAFRRLAEYMAQAPGKPGATSYSISAGSVSISHRRSASFMARAMENSGAGDLLRSYRRAH